MKCEDFSVIIDLDKLNRCWVELSKLAESSKKPVNKSFICREQPDTEVYISVRSFSSSIHENRR